MEDNWYSIKQEITRSMTDFGFRVYVSITDIYGNTKYIDAELGPFEEVIKKSIMINLPYLDIGDYCMPLSSKNLMIFKISGKSMVILFANKGNLAQLLSFKKNINYFQEKIDLMMGDVEIPSEIAKIPPEITKAEKKPVQKILGKQLPFYLPFLNKDIGKSKVMVDEIMVLQLCDGNHAFSDMVRETGQTEEFVIELMNKQMKKKMLSPKAHPFVVKCPDCDKEHHLYILVDLFKNVTDQLKVLIRSEKCNHEFVVFIDKKLKVELQSFKYYTGLQKDKFMKRLGEHYYMIIS